MTENTERESGVALSAAQQVTTLGDLRYFLGALHAKWREDPEVGHSVNDEIRGRVLQMCAEGHPEAAMLAREVLVTDTWDDVPSWCA